MIAVTVDTVADVPDTQHLPIGTRVQKRTAGRRARLGTVKPHEPEHSHGCFPVRFDDGIWEKCDASDVTIVETTGTTTITPRSARSKARAV